MIETEYLEPFFEKNNIPIVFACDNNLLYMLSVALKSLIENTNKDKNYDIIIINNDFSSETKKKLISMLEKKHNANLRFINIDNYLEKFDQSIFYTPSIYTKAAYFRLFIPLIFKNFSKILYFDSDLVFHCDVSEIFNMHLDDKFLLASKDFGVHFKLGEKNEKDMYYHYLKNDFLKLKDYNGYFQSGVMLIDVKKFIENNIFEKSIETLRQIKTPLHVEQDILNVVLKGHVKFLHYKYNITTVLNLIATSNKIKKCLQKNLYKEYKEAQKDIKILHNCSYKPYCFKNKIKIHKSFWQYAKTTPFCDELEKLRKTNIKTGNTIDYQTSFWRKLKIFCKMLENVRVL